MTDADRSAEIWSALGAVTDPEIDESVTSLEFITSVRIESGNSVRIEFRLPTYWCAPNFAFLMASDMRDAVAELSWVEKVTVELLDHFSANLINRGVYGRRWDAAGSYWISRLFAESRFRPSQCRVQWFHLSRVAGGKKQNEGTIDNLAQL
jgi:metal-sulfur cluster biosynthetic enzyme